jgi:hypothetical protein
LHFSSFSCDCPTYPIFLFFSCFRLAEGQRRREGGEEEEEEEQGREDRR